jgi:hypothetical protein
LVAVKSAVMLEYRQSMVSWPFGRAALCSGRDRLMVRLALFALTAAGEAMAGEQAPITPVKLDPAIANFIPQSPAAGPVTPAPGDFTLPTAGGVPVYSTTEFRPRKHSVMDPDPVASSFADAPLMRTTTVWERLSDYKSHDRVQVLTLWQTRGSSVSLQAGRHGDPSLQWTSRLMNRGGSTQGLLDRLFSVSIADAAKGFRNATHSMGTTAPPKAAGSSPQPVAAAAAK